MVPVAVVINPVPVSLPIWALLLGLGALFVGVTLQMINEREIFPENDRARLVTTVALGVGFLLSCLSVLQSAVGGYAIFLVLAFRFLEGAAAVHFYQRALAVIKSGSLDAAFSGDRLQYSVAKLLVILVGLMILFDILALATGGLWQRVRIVYTLIVGGTSALGARFRLRAVDDELNQFIIYGLVACIFGAELFDFTLGIEVIVAFAGALAFSAGFWLCATGWVGLKML